LKEESLAENKALGLEQMQEEMDMIFSVLKQNGINIRLWMEEYLTACEESGGNAPPDCEKFLPWNMSPELRARVSRESTFSHGSAKFIQAPDGTVYHAQKDGRRIPIVIGDMTAEEFEKLTGLDTGGSYIPPATKQHLRR
jgi:hypothetical protein